MIKLFFLSFLITIICVSVQGQSINGSWINSKIIDYYQSDEVKACDIKFFGDNKFVPLYLSFDRTNHVIVTFRIEQPKLNYKVKLMKTNFFVITHGKNKFEIHLNGDSLTLNYNQNLITFKKVINTYTNDVFGNYIKNIIFGGNKKFIIKFLTQAKRSQRIIIKRSNFLQEMKEILKCKNVEFAQLGTFNYNKFCLPELALYNCDNNKSNGPIVLGIFIQNDFIKFIDNSKKVILELQLLR